MRKFIPFILNLCILSILPLALMYVLQIYITDFDPIHVMEKDYAQWAYYVYLCVVLFFVGIDYTIKYGEED